MNRCHLKSAEGAAIYAVLCTAGYNVSDLSKPLMLEYLREVGSALADDADEPTVEALARQMNLVGGPSESPWPKNVGLLFFNETPDRFFPYAQIDVVWFPRRLTGLVDRS